MPRGIVLQIDHPLPHACFGDDDQGYNVLCHECHGHKSYLEALTPFQENPLASVFEPSVFESFVKSPNAKQAVHQLHVPKTQTPTEIDVSRCRRSAPIRTSIHCPCSLPWTKSNHASTNWATMTP